MSKNIFTISAVIAAFAISFAIAYADSNTLTATQSGNRYEFACSTGADTVTIYSRRVPVLTMGGDCGAAWEGSSGNITATAEVCDAYLDYVMCSVRPLDVVIVASAAPTLNPFTPTPTLVSTTTPTPTQQPTLMPIPTITLQPLPTNTPPLPEKGCAEKVGGVCIVYLPLIFR